ncbi:CDP-alcohol phosphatidyltransferase family protein [Thaumasiovibrio subtropicus]|uniref:CDP-alcohol phosphatidyltransferase family protein n=1 Tax=Thaumasiovibrio subtropicus TaxID=1891207 RepID=UPI000B359706|nr:CDP-alcohol phosphatidyltransferase family protein [Thaumasiovibrio subtropicus]
MSVYRLKPAFQRLLAPCVHGLARRSVTPNQITVATLLITVAGVGAIALLPPPYWLGLPLLQFLRMALNAIDGQLARLYNQITPRGMLLNEVGDLLADAVVWLAFLSLGVLSPFWIAVVALLTWLTEFIAVLVAPVTGERANHGPMGKSDRAVVTGVFAIIIAVQPNWLVYGDVALILVAGLLLVTASRRAMKVWSLVPEQKDENNGE